MSMPVFIRKKKKEYVKEVWIKILGRDSTFKLTQEHMRSRG